MLLIAFGCDTNTLYTQYSIEIEVVKSNIGYYSEGDWEPYEANYAEGTTIFFNTSEENPPQFKRLLMDKN